VRVGLRQLRLRTTGRISAICLPYSINLADERLPIGHDGRTHVAGMVDWLCEHWDQPEDGIWETVTVGRTSCAAR
jgi:hypothetical protein